MPDRSAFHGFTKQTVAFLNGLKRNNNREWFEAHRADYEQHVLDPAKAFVVALGNSLRGMAPGLVALPKINGSIFRLNRDTRFSPDKTPYKTHLAVFLWEGEERLEGSGFYFHLEPPNLMLGAGIYIFPKSLLGRYRSVVAEPERGRELSKLIERLRRKGFEVGGKRLKRPPAGFDPADPRVTLLMHTGLYAGTEMRIPQEIYSPNLLSYCRDKFGQMAPLHHWLVRLSRGDFDR
ncbi:MAG: DUF2461 domain-containing protein [Acidobacteriota bacterium]